MPERRCSACRTNRPAAEMIRLVAAPDGALAADLRGVLGGRGAWSCASKDCLDRASRGGVSRSLKRCVQKAPDGAMFETVSAGLQRLLGERLGRLQKQGGLVVGASSAEAADREGFLQGIIAAQDLSERSSKKVDALRAPVYRVARQLELGSWLGRGATGVVGVPMGREGEKALVEAQRWCGLTQGVSG